MVQEFQVTRCAKCQLFQTQQVKKVPRWSCKVCGEKQSLLKEYGRGSAADCRRHVQKLNSAWGAMEEEEEEQERSEQEQDSDREQESTPIQTSRWNKYLDTPVEAEPEQAEEDDRILMDRQDVHSKNLTDRKRKRKETSEEGRPSVRTSRLKQSSELDQSGPRAVNQSRTTALGQNQRRTKETGPSSPDVNQSTSNTGQNRCRTRITGLNPPSAPDVNQFTASTMGENQTRVMGENQTRARIAEMDQTNPPGLRFNPSRAAPLGLVSGSTWTRFLSPEPSVTEGGGDITTRPQPRVCVSSMFQTEEEFNMDDDFLL